MGKISPCALHHDLLLQMNAEGYMRKEMADRIGVLKAAVQTYLSRRGIEPNFGEGRLQIRHEAQIRQAIEVERKTQQQAADDLGVHRSTVERIARRLDLKTCRTGPRSASGHRQQWRGGRTLSKGFYIDVFVPLHPLARRTGYVGESRLLKEVELGRYLTEEEVVDHADSHVQRNWPDNLQLFPSNADHLRATLTGREKRSLVRSIYGEWKSSLRRGRCPSPDETLALCPSEIRAAYERHVLIHRPTKEHASEPRRRLWRQGPWAPAFQSSSRV